MIKLLLCLLLLCASAFAQTTISDKFPLGAGSIPWYKSLVVSWPAYTTAQGQAVAAGSRTITVAADGSFSAQLAPGDTAVPHFQYTVQLNLQNGTLSAATSWLVPTTPLTLGLSQVEVPQPGSKSGVVLSQLRCAACKTGDVPTFNGSQFESVNVAAFEAAGSAAAVLNSSTQKGANLADVANPAAALANVGGVTAPQAAAAAPVQSVAGRSGTIVLAPSDIAGLGTAATHNASEFDLTGAAAAAQANALSSSVQKALNLSDVGSPSAALANLGGTTSAQAASAAPVQTVAGRSGNITLSNADIAGLGTSATHAVGDFDAAGAAATAQAAAVAASTQKTANLADVASPALALANLGGVTVAQAGAASPVQSVAGRKGAIVLSTSDVTGLGTAARQSVSDFDPAGAAAAAANGAVALSAQRSQNLSDLASPATALLNLGGVTAAQAASVAPVNSVAGRIGAITLGPSDIAGLGSAATHAATDFDSAGAATAVQATGTQKSANLSDVANAATALTNLHGVTAAQAAGAAPVQTVAGVSPAAGNVPLASGNLSDTATLLRSNTTTAQSLSGPITVPQLNGVFNVDGFPASGCTVNTTTYTTQLDCANATANAWIAANAQSATLFFGNSGVYPTCTGVTLPPTGGSIASLSLVGQGRGWQHGAKSATQIKQTCAITTAVVNKAAGTTTYLYPELTINNIEINANNLSPACLDLYGVSGDYQNISCFGINGSDHFIKIGDNLTAQGGAYEVFARNIKVDGGAYGAGGAGAAFSANLVSGALSTFSQLSGITAVNVTGGGSGYTTSASVVFTGGTCTLQPQAFVSAVSGTTITAITVNLAGACSAVPTGMTISGGAGATETITSALNTGSGYSAYAKVALYGYGSSLNLTQPCTTMPTNNVVIATDGSGHITGLSLFDATVASTGSGCTGTVDVQVQDVYPASYGIVINSTDSDYSNLVVQKAGALAGIVVNHSQNTFMHPHCYGSQPICIQDWGGNDYTAAEGDVVAHYTFDLEGNGTNVRGSKSFMNPYGYFPGVAKYYISPASLYSTVQESTTLTGTVMPDEHTFVAVGGVIDTVTVAGTSTFVGGGSMPSSVDLQTNSFRIMAQSTIDGPGGGSWSLFNGSLVVGNKIGKFGDSTGSQLNMGATGVATVFSRNNADAYAALAVQNKNASSTGDIMDLQNSSGNITTFSLGGNIVTAGTFQLEIGASPTEPTCTAALRSTFFVVHGAPDHLDVCINSTTNGTYAWSRVF